MKTKTIFVDFDALPEGKSGPKDFTKKQDADILKYFGRKNQRAFSDAFSKKYFMVGRSTIKARYEKLTQGET